MTKEENDIRHFILETKDYGNFDVVEYEKYKELQQEINRLNNIIDELSKWLKTERDYYFDNYYYSDFNAYGSKLNDVLDKLNELKGDNK